MVDRELMKREVATQWPFSTGYLSLLVLGSPFSLICCVGLPNATAATPDTPDKVKQGTRRWMDG